MATLSFFYLLSIDLQWENWKLAFIAISLQTFDDFFFFFFAPKCLLSGSLPNIYFLSKPLNLIGCPGNQKIKFAKIIKKSTPQ